MFIYIDVTGPPNPAAGFVTHTQFHTNLQYLSVFRHCIDVGVFINEEVEGHIKC